MRQVSYKEYQQLTINLSILDFKLGLVYDLERYRKRYKSIHIGF